MAVGADAVEAQFGAPEPEASRQGCRDRRLQRLQAEYAAALVAVEMGVLVAFVANRVEAPGAVRPGYLVGQFVAYQPVQGAIQGHPVVADAAGVQGGADFVVADRPTGLEQYREHRGAGTGDASAAGGYQAGGISMGLGHGMRRGNLMQHCSVCGSRTQAGHPSRPAAPSGSRLPAPHQRLRVDAIGLEIRGRQRLAEQVALDAVAAPVVQPPQMFVGLDALRDHFQVEGMGQ